MLNPITYTEKVVADFLRYQITTYPFADNRLYEQMRERLSLEQTRETPLLQGPFISLSRSFQRGAKLQDLASEGVLHPHIATLAPYPHTYGHQERAYRAIAEGRTTLVSTGTGSGKTECFLYPIISRCLSLRDEEADAGIVAVIVYPMNALAEDQLGRLRELLVGTGVSFAMYTGRTPERTDDVSGVRLQAGASRADYAAKLKEHRKQNVTLAIHPAEEQVSREEMRRPGGAPRILLTNVKQLELLLTRQKDVELFDDALLEYLVFDEAHTFTGAAGAETACLVRRLRAFCGKQPDETVCIATSATIADPERGPEAGREFAARFFGVKRDDVAMVGELYEEDAWASERTAPPPLPGDPSVHLQTILEVVGGVEQENPDPGELRRLKSVFQAMTGASLDLATWQESLYQRLAANEVVFQIAQALQRPKPLRSLLCSLAQRLGRDISEEEILCWLALGASSRSEGRPLLRPVVHAFVRGISGAVVTFPQEDDRPKLWLSAEDVSPSEDASAVYRLPVMTCTTCGQHYYVHHVSDFRFDEAKPGGGEAVDDRVIWRPLDPTAGGYRVVLVDSLVADDESEEDDVPRNTAALYFCRKCGTLHSSQSAMCDGCGSAGSLLRLWVVRFREGREGYLSSCLSCGAIGHEHVGRFREPARPVRALTVSDVHVLAQSMIHHAERRRLLVFSDNRQDAAFQAGWMQDHARRYRFRALAYERISESAVSVGDLVAWLDDRLDADDDLSRSLLPEVWRVARKEAAGNLHAAERKRFLRIQVLREISTGTRQRIGLEPWGRIRIRYVGLSPDLPFIGEWSSILGIGPEELREGIASLLDNARRGRMLLDREVRMFSRFWHESDREVQRGYMPLMQGGPKGLKLRREDDDHKTRVQQWISARGDTVARQAARRWGVDTDHMEAFFEGLWKLLSDELGLLAAVTLTGTRGGALPGCTGVRQVDADKVLLEAQKGTYRCSTCRRTHVRMTPGMACLGWRCNGTISFQPESEDDYDLMVLDHQFAMVRPREHSAQVPPHDREIIERAFKGQGELLNTLVCTPTLELGVDIGALDAVLMRNVPPLPANYWQRTGRAGRRHRMAVNLTYARPASHDRAYFVQPLKMLEGLVHPPRFNLKNEIMVRKHVHATILSALFQLAREGSGLLESDRVELGTALGECLPRQVSHYLFENGNLRTTSFDVAPIRTIVSKHRSHLLERILEVFSQGWPEEDRSVVSDEKLGMFLDSTADELDRVVRRLAARLKWALDQMSRLSEVRAQKGTLDPEEDALFHRCDRLVKRLKAVQSRRKRDAEGFDDTNTYSVLAAEGFLPGYGLDTGWVVGFHQAPRFSTDLTDWELRRSPSLALREYVPGNLIYANGHRFVPRFFHLEAVEPLSFQVDRSAEAVAELGLQRQSGPIGMGTQTLDAMPICDVDLPHQSHISDDEDYRFQLAVAVYGHEQARHGGGRAFQWGPRTLTHRRNVHLRLVNVGAAMLVQGKAQLGYPVCSVCGQSRSPFASQAELKNFEEEHLARCGKPVGRLGFYADVVADALALQDCENKTVAFSVMEALRQGAAEVLEMEVDDLQVLAVGQPGTPTTDVVLYDPMPGGSGLLEQILLRWEDVVSAATNLVQGCSSECASACIDCLLLFRNAFYHRHLNRHSALEVLSSCGTVLAPDHPIPPRLPDSRPADLTVNSAAQLLKRLLERAGFSGFLEEHPLPLGLSLGTTTPDFFFNDPNGHYEGIAIYLDGMSGHIHGNPQTRARDRQLREELRSRFYEVFEITYNQLLDKESMTLHFFRLGRVLLGREGAESLRDNSQWFEYVCENDPDEPPNGSDG